MKLLKYLGMVLVVLGFVSMFSSLGIVIFGITGETHIEEIECYDKYSNEILGLVCEDIVGEYDDLLNYIPSLMFGGMLLVLTGGLTYTYNSWEEEE